MALDLGDRWIGSALSDSLKCIARPYKTVERDNLYTWLQLVFTQEDVDTVIIGYPKTMKGAVSQQTQKVLDEHQLLVKQFPSMVFVLWDERLSSKRAQSVSKQHTPQEKEKAHSIAAAFILDSYLAYLAYCRDSP